MQKYKSVEEFLAHLNHAKLEQVQELRTIIQSSHTDLIEVIKWNSPSFVLNGNDRITFNLQNKEEKVQLILHMGAIRKEDKNAKPVLAEDFGLIKWNSDIRGILTFQDLSDIISKKDIVTKILKLWLAIEV